MEYTPEHFEELHDRNENFDGRVADFGKFATYNQIKTALVDFMQRCDEVERIDEQSPIPHKIGFSHNIRQPKCLLMVKSGILFNGNADQSVHLVGNR